jgi:hypothetical protein
MRALTPESEKLRDYINKVCLVCYQWHIEYKSRGDTKRAWLWWARGQTIGMFTDADIRDIHPGVKTVLDGWLEHEEKDWYEPNEQ